MPQNIPLDLLFRAVRILLDKEYMALSIDNFFFNHVDSELG
jgi:hypothetical protein